MDAQPQHDRGDAEEVETGVEKRARMHEEDEDEERRRRQERHEVVPDRERQDEHHQEQDVVVLAAPEALPPAEGQPGEQRNGEEGDGVDLLVDSRLVPDREGGRTEQCRRRGARQAEASVCREVTQDVMDDQEPEAVRHRRHERREQVDPDSRGKSEDPQDDLPGAARVPRTEGSPVDGEYP